ncbi:MAG: PQQ-binding-like beta-propeller repeat protein [Anaerolineales bacterium]|nr:MAG: PQQ-binding-like beta-propeller repeat protein [Anaerolineales bacterium]
MDRHLSEDQLTRHVYRTLTDAQREMMDIHLGTCQECRASLAGHEALQRRARYSVMDRRRGISMSPQASFADIAPRLRRSRRFATLWTGSRQFVYGLATLAVLVVLAFGLALYFRDISQSAESMYKGGPQRTGAYDVKGPKHGELLWQFTTKSTIMTTPVVVDGVAYVGSQDGFLRALDSHTGEEKWKFDAGRPVLSTPAVARGTVYFGSGCIGGSDYCLRRRAGSDYYFYALDRQTGQEKWRFQVGGGVASSPLIAHGLVYFGSEDQHLYALDSRTGQQKWRFTTEDVVWGSPAMADGVVYFGAGCYLCTTSEDRHLYAVDSQTGREMWRFETGDWVESTPVVADGVVYFGSGDTHVYAVDSQTGQEKWRFKTEGGVQDSLALSAGVVYVGSRDQHLYAIDSRTGQELWKVETGGASLYGPAIADGVVYFGSNATSDLYALDSQTGQVLWRFQNFVSCCHSGGSGLALGEGVMYIVSDNVNLTAVGDPQQ